MGSPMAGHLSKMDGCDVYVHNRSASKIDAWLSRYDGKSQAPEHVYDAIIMCVGGDNDVEEQLVGEGALLEQLRPGCLVVDHTTTSAGLAKHMSEAAERNGKFFVDAPVSGGQAGAENGQLACMMGGPKGACDAATKLVDAYCKVVVRVGDSGAGQTAKMANQLCIAGVIAGLSEAIHLAQQESDIDIARVFEAISGGAAQSWQMDNRSKTMIDGEFDFGFALDHMIKDLGFALEKARSQGWEPKVASYVQQTYLKLSELGMGTQDTSALIEAYRRNMGLD